MTPAATIAALRRGAEIWRATDDADVREVGAILAVWLANRSAPRLETALGLTGLPGQRRASTLAAAAEVDALLREAAQRFLADLSVAAQANEIEMHLTRYETTAWLRERGQAQCPVRHKGTIREYCFRILKVGGRSQSAESIRRKLGRSSTIHDQQTLLCDSRKVEP